MIGLMLCCLTTELPASCVVDGSVTTPCARCHAPVWLAPSGQTTVRAQRITPICRHCFDVELLHFRDAATAAAREVRS